MHRGWETVDRDGEVQAGPCRTERLHLQQRHQLLGLQSAEVGQVLQSADMAIFYKDDNNDNHGINKKNNFFDCARLMSPLMSSCSVLFSFLP